MRRLLSLAMLAVGAAGCLNPDDIFPVTGTVVALEPVAGKTVRLLREPRRNQFGTCDGTGLQPFKEAVVDADGGYLLEVFRAQALSLTTGAGVGFCMRVETGFDSGTEAFSDLIVFGPTQLGPLRDWRPAMRHDGGALAFEPPIPWPDELAALDGGLVTSLDHQLRVLTFDGGLVWRADDRFPALPDPLDPFAVAFPVREPFLVDAVRLEDFTGTASLQALLVEPLPPQPSVIGSGSYGAPVTLRPAQTLPVAGSRVPFSRGLPCPPLAAPCPLTDGDLRQVDAGVSEVALEWAAPRAVSTVVLRGVGTDLNLLVLELDQPDGGVVGPLELGLRLSLLESSTSRPPPVVLPDGGWVLEPAYRNLFSVLAVDAGVPVTRAVLRFPGGLARVAEVSLFE